MIGDRTKREGSAILLSALLFCLLILACWSCFFELPQHRLLQYDDPIHVGAKPHLGSPGYLRELATGPVANLWHPLTSLSHDLVEALPGAEWKHHAFNLALHLCTGILAAYWLCSWGLPSVLSISLVALWWFHPLMAEPVAWVSARKDLLFGLFAVLSLLVAKRNGLGWKATGLALLAMTAKPTAVVLPVLLLVQLVASRKPIRPALPQLILLGVASCGLALLTAYFQSQGAQAIEDPRSWIARLVGSGHALASSVKLALAPGWLADLHVAYRNPTQLSWFWGMVWIFFLMGITASWWVRRRHPLLLVGLALFLLPLLPTLGLLRAGDSLVADRYLYLPVLGIVVMVTGLFAPYLGGNGKHPRKGQWVFAVCCFLLVALFANLLRDQRRDWRSEESLFQAVLVHDPSHPFAHARLASISLQRGDREEAKALLTKALQAQSDLPLAHHFLGQMAFEEGHFAESLEHYMVVKRFWPQEAWVLGRIAEISKRLDHE